MTTTTLTSKIIHSLQRLTRGTRLKRWLEICAAWTKRKQEARRLSKQQERTRELMKHARSLFADCDYHAAAQKYRQALAKGSGGGNLRLLATAHCELADVFQELKLEAQAKFELELASALINQLAPAAASNDPLLLKVQNNLRIMRATIQARSGLLCEQQQNFAVARERLSGALDELADAKSDPIWKAQLLGALAESNIKLGDSSQAIDLLERAMTATKGACMPNDRVVLGLRARLHYAQDMSLLSEVFPGDEAARLNEAQKKVDDLNLRCTQLVLAGALDNAKDVAGEALQYALEQFGSTHWLVPKSRNLVAWTLMHQQDWWGALAELEMTKGEMKIWWGEFPELSQLVRNNFAICERNTRGA